MADQPFSPEDLLASVAAAMPPGPQTSPVQQDQGNNPVGQMQQMSQNVNPNPAQPQQPRPQGPPTPRPILFDLMRAIKPEQQAPQVGALGALGPQRTGNRLEHFESFLGNFLNAFATGMGAARGPGAFGKGMAAAAAAPYQRGVQQYQMGQQQQMAQAEMQKESAQTQLAQAQAQQIQGMGQTVQTPLGPMSERLARVIMPQYVRGGAAAEIKAKSDEQNKVPIDAGTATELNLPPALIGAKVAPKDLLSAAKTKTPNEIELTTRALHGDADAKSVLDSLQTRRLELQKARGIAFGQGRLWQLQSVINPDTGQQELRTGFDILNAQKQGVNFTPSGRMPAQMAVAVQQLQTEANPAIQGVRDNITAFDNGNDRAIFARVLRGAGNPQYGHEATWMGSVLNQALKEGLSPQGQKLAVRELRLAETMGRLRSVVGLPATDTAMALTLGLLPGASTPNSKYATDQLDQIQQMVTQAVSPPVLRGIKTIAPSTQGGGSNVDSLVSKYK